MRITFLGNLRTLLPTNRPIFGVTANHFWPIANHFSDEFAKTFWSSPLFLDKFYIRNKSANNDSQFVNQFKK